MKRVVTTLALLGVLPYAAQAQTIFDKTVKEIFAVSPANLTSAAQKAAAGTLTNAEYEALTRSSFTDRVAPVDTLVRFTAVLLSDPFNSGLASSTGGRPNRLHVFVRDVTAATDPNGMRGYVAQIVDGAWDTDGLNTVGPGAVVRVTGSIAYFNGTPQISPTSLQVINPDYATQGIPATIVQPITLPIADLNTPNGVDANSTPQAVLNFANFNPNANEYVQLASARVEFTQAFSNGTRYNVVFSNTERTAFIALNDISLRYRSDRTSTYGTGFNVRTTNYVPPAPGSTVIVKGFITPTTSDFVNYFLPNPNVSIVPMEDADVVLDANAAPSVANVTRPTGVTTGSSAVTVTADVLGGSARTISSVALRYTTEGGTQMSAPMTLVSGTRWTGTIPTSALQDGKFVTYTVFATDNQGGTGESAVQSFRVLAQGIRSIEHIQRTASGSIGDSPFAGTRIQAASSQLDITATVQTKFDFQTSATATTPYITIQDDAALGAWSGVQLFVGTTTTYDQVRALNVGDRIRITSAKVFESSGVTTLDSLAFTSVGTATPYAAKVLVTTDLSQPSFGEAHESMLVRLNAVTVTNANPDAPSNFGEYLVQTTGGAGAVRVDDASTGIADNPNATLTAGSTITFVQGLWTFRNSNFKLEPITTADVGTVTPSATEEEVRAQGFGLLGLAPNPTRGSATVRFLTTGTDAASLEVYDVLGRRVASFESATTGEQTVALDAASFAPGVYVLRLSQSGRVDTKPFVVAR